MGLLEWIKEKKLSKKHDSTVNTGHASFMTQDEIKRLKKKMQRKEKDNDSGMLLLSENIRIPLNEPRLSRLNAFVIGGSHSGKTRNFILPNILESNENFIIADPNGELQAKTEITLREKGYEIKTLNLIDVHNSSRYNPFHYMRREKDAFLITDILYAATTNNSKQVTGDTFFENSEKVLLCALLLYLWHCAADEKDRTLKNVLTLLAMSNINENTPDEESPLDQMFTALEKVDPNNLAVNEYKHFKMMTGKTQEGVIIRLASRLTLFSLTDAQYLTEIDEMDLDNFRMGKHAIFVTIPTIDHGTIRPVINMLFSQLVSVLYRQYEKMLEEKTDRTGLRPVRVYLNDLADIAVLWDFDKTFATMRKYNISCSVTVNAISQLKKVYKDGYSTILSCCGAMLYLGTEDSDTNEWFSKVLGDRYPGMPLMTPEQLPLISNYECIVKIPQYPPIYDKKYRITD